MPFPSSESLILATWGKTTAKDLRGEGAIFLALRIPESGLSRVIEPTATKKSRKKRLLKAIKVLSFIDFFLSPSLIVVERKRKVNKIHHTSAIRVDIDFYFCQTIFWPFGDR